MKHIQVIAYCDGTHDERVRSTIERTVSIDGSKPIMLDLCEPCDKVFEDLSVLLERGTVADTAKATRPVRQRDSHNLPTTCPDCGYKSPTRSALGAHVKNRHGKGIKDFTVEQFEAAERQNVTA